MCDFVEYSNTAILITFKYSVEATNDVQDPYSILPQLEETLLKKLAKRLLIHCIDDFDFRKLMNNDGDRIESTQTAEMLTTTTTQRKKYQRRMLKSRRRLETVGLCSAPIDEHVEEGKIMLCHNPKFIR